MHDVRTSKAPLIFKLSTLPLKYVRELYSDYNKREKHRDELLNKFRLMGFVRAACGELISCVTDHYTYRRFYWLIGSARIAAIRWINY